MAHESYERSETAQLSSNRAFGFVFAAVFFAIAIAPWFSHHPPRPWAAWVGGLFALTALARPTLLAPINRLWMRLGALLNRVTSPVMLATMFVLVITPMGMAMRWLGKDPLRLRLDRSLPSYWIERAPSEPKPNTFTDQF
jgi:hypothetical protein